MLRHATLLGEWIGDEARGVIDFRKHVAWYLKGFAVGSEMRKRLAITSSLAELEDGLGELDLDQAWPAGADGPRGRTSGNNRVVLPDGWLKDPYDCAGVERGRGTGHLGRLRRPFGGALRDRGAAP